MNTWISTFRVRSNWKANGRIRTHQSESASISTYFNRLISSQHGSCCYLAKKYYVHVPNVSNGPVFITDGVEPPLLLYISLSQATDRRSKIETRYWNLPKFRSQTDTRRWKYYFVYQYTLFVHHSNMVTLMGFHPQTEKSDNLLHPAYNKQRTYIAMM